MTSPPDGPVSPHIQAGDHPGLRRLRSTGAGAAWLDDLGRLVRECADAWSLSLGDPYPYATASLALRARTPDGGRAVLKVQFPDRESEHEAAALQRWDGDGAVRLLAYDEGRHALLLEQCLPGTPLSSLEPDAATAVMIGLVARLAKPAAAPFRPLADEGAHWRAKLEDRWEEAGRPVAPALLEAVMELLAVLPGSQGEQVLVHQDLHGDNVLRSERQPWLAIDPKPLTGELEFAVAPVVRSAELGHSRGLVHRRLDRLVRELGLNAERARGWAMSQALAWGFDGGQAVDRNLEVARWLFEGP